MVLVLIGVHMAPNRVLTGSPGRELQGGADYRVGLVPDIQKCTNIFGDPAGPGRVLARFSVFFSEWSGKVPEGPRTIIWGLGVGWVEGGVLFTGGFIVHELGLFPQRHCICKSASALPTSMTNLAHPAMR